MILVLGNFAGVFSNIIKLLSWSIQAKDSDIILFYYANKSNNDDWRIMPFQNYEQDLHRIFFYKYFQIPQECSLQTFLQAHKFEMGYPAIPFEELPSFLQPYKNGFISCSAKLFSDPNLPKIREFYHILMKKRLQFTPFMEDYMKEDLTIIKELQQQGKRILAVFIRCTLHFVSYDVDKVFEEIKSVAKDYDYILPITQIGPFFNYAKTLFGDKCISFPRHYLAQNMDWTRPMSDVEFEDEFRSAIRDVYLASQCDFVLGGSSNMFLGALFWNPIVPYKIFDELVNKNGE